MSEHDLETRLRGAVHAEAEEADPGALHERVLSIPDKVEPRRRRWWHGLGFGAGRGAGLDGARVTGGSMMFSAVRMAAVVAALAVGTTFAISTVSGPAEPPAPAAEAPIDAEWVGVTGTGRLSLHMAEATLTGVQEMSDARVSGDVYITWSIEFDQHGDLGNWTIWGAKQITNDTGAWEGEYVAFVEPDGTRNTMTWMEGSGAYEGLTYLEHMHGPIHEAALTGLVYPGSIPPTVVLGMDGPLTPAAPLPAE